MTSGEYYIPKDYTHMTNFKSDEDKYCEVPAHVDRNLEDIDLNQYWNQPKDIRDREIKEGMGAVPEINAEQPQKPEYGECPPDPPKTDGTDSDNDLNRGEDGENFTDLSGGTEVYESNSDGWQEADEIEKTPEIISEDTENYKYNDASEKEEAEKFMDDNPDLFSKSDSTDTITPTTNDDNYYHNKDSESFTMGKYDGGSENSYINKARETDSSYFSIDESGKWDEIRESGIHEDDRIKPYNDDEMYKETENEKFENDMLDENKEVQLSHSPNPLDGYTDGTYGNELETFYDRTGETHESFEEGEDGMYRLSDPDGYKTRYDEGEPPWQGDDEEQTNLKNETNGYEQVGEDITDDRTRDDDTSEDSAENLTSNDNSKEHEQSREDTEQLQEEPEQPKLEPELEQPESEPEQPEPEPLAEVDVSADSE